jgi:hypothetical protein
VRKAWGQVTACAFEGKKSSGAINIGWTDLQSLENAIHARQSCSFELKFYPSSLNAKLGPLGLASERGATSISKGRRTSAERIRKRR